MTWVWMIFIALIRASFVWLRPDGVKAIVAENMALRQQLMVLMRGKKRCPPLRNHERILLAFCTLLIPSRRLGHVSIAIAKSTLLKMHKALVGKKYSALFSNKTKRKPGPKGPSKALIQFIVEMKEKNPSYGCPKIAALASNVLERPVSESLVERILKKHFRQTPGGGPSWLTPIGNAPDKLWSIDFFRLESVFLKSYWVMVVMDQFSRKIVGFSVHRGDLTGQAVCYLFNRIIAGKTPPKYLSSDHDPLFNYWLWLSNLEQYGIEEIKTVPNCPWSHPFIERKIGSTRREFTDRILSWNKRDLETKLGHYQDYFNQYRVHEAHTGRTPNEKRGRRELSTVTLGNRAWKPLCGGLFYTPIAA